MIALSLHPRSVRESADGFRRYLDAEGAVAARQRVEREGLLDGTDSLTRRYAKYAKTLVQVGAGGGHAFARPAGHVIEFVPLRDPTSLRTGGTLELRLLFRGAPLAGSIRTIHVTQAPAGSGADWDTHWGTLVFALDPSSQGRHE